MDHPFYPHQYLSIDNNFGLEHRCTSLSPALTCYHYHNGCEVYLFLGGQATMYVETNAYPLTRGDLFVFRPDELHRASCLPDQPYERCTIHLKDSFLRSVSSEQTDLTQCFFDRPLGSGNKCHLNNQDLQELLLLFHRLDGYVKGDAYGDDLLSLSSFTEFFVKLNQLYRSNVESHASYMPTLVKETMDYIETHLTQELSLRELADHLYHNGAYISRRFKEETGISIRQYIIYKRVILAKSLLAEGKSLTDVCFLSGFHDYTNFNRTFTKQVGCAPGKFQRQLME